MTNLKLYTTAKNLFSILAREHSQEEISRAFDLLKVAVDKFESACNKAEDGVLYTTSLEGELK